MSRYCLIKTTFSDVNALVSALVDTGGWSVQQIEQHSEPQHLYGYKGDERQEKANVIIRKKHIGNASNDIGFLKDNDGNYVSIISDFDKSKYNAAWLATLKQNYVYHRVYQEQSNHGRKVTREKCQDGKQRIVISGYR